MSEFDITFLGTCAYDYNEKLKTEFKNKFDLDARRSSSLIFNKHYLIDCGDHTLNALSIINKDLKDIRDIFITHTHSDHFNIESIEKIALSKKTMLNLWIREDANIPNIKNVNIIKMERHKTYNVNNEFTVVGMLANHDEDSYPQHLLFEKNSKKFLYACDGAWFLTSTYYFLEKANLDLCILDGTCGNYLGDYRMSEHNSIPMIKLMLPSLKKWGTINDNTKVYISHLAPSLHKPHNEIKNNYKDYGINVAYDGLNLKI